MDCGQDPLTGGMRMKDREILADARRSLRTPVISRSPFQQSNGARMIFQGETEPARLPQKPRSRRASSSKPAPAGLPQ